MSYFPAILSDPQLAISKRDRNLILGSASSAWFKKPLNMIVYIASIVVWVAIMIAARILLNKASLNSTLNATILWLVLFPILLVGCHYLIFHLRFRPFLYQALREEGYDICLKCGYILIDIPTSKTKCPECGTPRSPLPTKPAAD